MSELRNRIAAVLYEDGQRPMATAHRLAEAVIRELGLKRDQLGADIGYPHQQYRYVTEWMPNE